MIGVLLLVVLPRDPGRTAPEPRRSWRRFLPAGHALRDRRFIAFAALHSVDLLAYNQLYLAVPLMLAGTPSPVRDVAIVFAWMSILTLAAQVPIARGSALLGARAALRLAYLLNAAGFALIAVTATLPSADRLGWAVAAATCFGLGHLLAGPTALSLVPLLAPEQDRGSYFGLLASMGGIAVLVGNPVAGALADAVPAALSWAPWLLLGLAPIASAILAPRLLPGRATVPAS